MERTDRTASEPSRAERIAALHAQCRADYGTPEQRAQRAAEAGIQSALARAHGNEAGGAFRGRRP